MKHQLLLRKPVPASDHPQVKKKIPNVHSEPPLAQLCSISAHSITDDLLRFSLGSCREQWGHVLASPSLDWATCPQPEDRNWGDTNKSVVSSHIVSVDGYIGQLPVNRDLPTWVPAITFVNCLSILEWILSEAPQTYELGTDITVNIQFWWQQESHCSSSHLMYTTFKKCFFANEN